MPRSVTISLPTERADAVVEELSALDGALTLTRQREASIVPPGDVVTVEVLDRAMPRLLAVLTAHGVGTDDAVSATTSTPTAVVSSSQARALAHDPASSAFEEVESILERQSSMGANKLVAMAGAGVVAAAGLATDAVHLVIGAMVIAPGFEPFLKLSLRVAGRGRSLGRGLFDVAAGWAAVVAGAAAAGLVLPALGVPLEGSGAGYEPSGALVSYWRALTWTSTLVALVGGLVGTVLVVADRAVLTAGVMIALSLVPGAALVGMGVAGGDLALVGDGALLWAHDAVLVAGAGVVAFALYRARRRRALGTS